MSHIADDLPILGDETLFSVIIFQPHNYCILGTRYAYNHHRGMWFHIDRDRTILFSEMLDDILSDSDASNFIKEKILFNLNDLKNLPSDRFYAQQYEFENGYRY